MGVVASRENPCGCVAVHAREFLERLRCLKYSPKTLRIYLRALMDLDVDLQRQPVDEIRNVHGKHLETYRIGLIKRGLAPATVEVYLRTVRLFFGFLEREHILFMDPAESLVIPSPARRMASVPSEADIRTTLAHPDTCTPVGLRDRAILETAYSSAMRLNELVHLTLDGIDLADGTARILGKGCKERVVPLGEEAVMWLRRYITEVRPGLATARSDRLWLGSSGAPLTYWSIIAVFRHHGRPLGLETRISPHAFRRACATHMLRRGASPLLIQQLLGHASLKHLGRYLDLSIADIKAMHATTMPGA